MKTQLVFDYDGSLASIGSDEVLESTFGILPIRIHKGLETTRYIMKKLVRPEKSLLEHPLLDNVALMNDGFILSERAEKLKLDTLVFDTISACGFQERTQIKHKRGIEQMDQRAWGYYGDAINSFIYNICSLPIKTIFNVHIDRAREVGGEVLEVPALKGSSKTEIQKWFDVILFTHIRTDQKTKETTFHWITKPEEGRYAKDRLGLLPPVMPQDFNHIFTLYEEAGIKNPNILVCGESGTGKSRSLISINPQYNPHLRKVS